MMNFKSILIKTIFFFVILAIITAGFLIYKNLKVIDKEIESYIEIIFPTGGEQWNIGDEYSIAWESSGIEEIYINLVDLKFDELCLLNNGNPISTDENNYTFILEKCARYDDSSESFLKNSEYLISGLGLSGQRGRDYKIELFSLVEEESFDSNYKENIYLRESIKDPIKIFPVHNANDPFFASENWENYINGEYGFALNYPENFLIDENKENIKFSFPFGEFDGSDNINRIFKVSFKNKRGNFSSYCGAGISEAEYVMVVNVSVFDVGNDITLNDMTKNCEEILSGEIPMQGKNCFFYNRTIDNKDAADIRMNGIGGDMPSLYIADKNKIYLISMEYSCAMDVLTAEENFNDVLSSFKFLENL